jgi:hydroxyacylglutathione hydrolase
MFVAGCGKFNQGAPKDMHRALYEVLGALPEDTLVYVGHEYTVSNLRFAQAVDKGNKDVEEKLEWARAQREKGLPTIPSTIGSEWKTNPFLRCSQPEIQTLLGKPGEGCVHRAARSSHSETPPQTHPHAPTRHN